MTCKATGKNFYEETGYKLSNTSQLQLFEVLKDYEDGTKLMNIFKTYEINDDVNKSILFYVSHQMSDSEFLDNTAYYYYKNPRLWWVIPLMNNILNPFEDVSAGDLLKVLKPDYVYKLIKEIQAIKDL